MRALRSRRLRLSQITVWALALSFAAFGVLMALGVLGNDHTPAKAASHPAAQTVVKRVKLPNGNTFLVVKKAHCQARNIEVSHAAYARCVKGSPYPKCGEK
jgi:hypothetical protein